MEMSAQQRTNEGDGSDGSSLPKTFDQLSFPYFSCLVCLFLFTCSPDFDGDLRVTEMEELIGGGGGGTGRNRCFHLLVTNVALGEVISGREIANTVSRASVNKGHDCWGSSASPPDKTFLTCEGLNCLQAVSATRSSGGVMRKSPSPRTCTARHLGG